MRAQPVARGAGAHEVLLVEDNPGDVELIRVAFARSCASLGVAVVGNGEEALRTLRSGLGGSGSGPPRLVLLDLNLPGLSGRQVLAEMKADARLREIPVFVLSSSDAREDLASVRSLHASAFVIKPCGLAGYLEIAERVVRFLEATPGSARS